MSVVERPIRASLRDLPAPPAGCIGWPWTEETPQLSEIGPDGMPWPAISIVTPVHEGGQDLEATIRSVLLQGYPRLEYLVIDDGSTDGSAEILGRYLRWLTRGARQEHRELRAAINRGFEQATGDVFAYLTPDAMLRPGALAAVARAVGPRRGQHVAVGRCSFIDATGRFLGIEHPSQDTGVERILAVWKGQAIPLPSLFWTREAWRFAARSRRTAPSIATCVAGWRRAIACTSSIASCRAIACPSTPSGRCRGPAPDRGRRRDQPPLLGTSLDPSVLAPGRLPGRLSLRPPAARPRPPPPIRRGASPAASRAGPGPRGPGPPPCPGGGVRV